MRVLLGIFILILYWRILLRKDFLGLCVHGFAPITI